MSSTNVNTALALILAELQGLNGRISTLEGLVSTKSAPVGAAGGGAAKKERKTKAKSSDSGVEKVKRAPTAWLLFTARVREVLREAGFEGKSLGKECQMFCSSLKEENGDFSSWTESDILARRAAWTAPEVSKQAARGEHWKNGKKVVTPTGSSAASVVSDADGGAAAASDGDAAPAKKARKNPWADLTPEQKAAKVAAMKAGRAAKKAEAAPSDEEAPASDGEADGGAAAASVTSSEKKKRGPKKFSDMTPEELEAAKAKRAAKKATKTAEEPKPSAAESASAAAARLPLPASPAHSVASTSLDGFQRVILGGAPYWVNLASGHCYHRISDGVTPGGAKGEWAGIFHRTPKPRIDDSVPEPSDDFVLEDA